MQIVAFLIAGVLVAVDQGIKFWALQALLPVGTMPFIPHLFSLTYVENHGAAFSILQNKQLFLILVTSAGLLLVAYWMIKKAKDSRLFLSALTLILAGGVGNLIDRIARGYVIDYLNFLPVRFPVFNFADCCVVIGCGLFILYVILDEVHESRKKKQAATTTKTEE